MSPGNFPQQAIATRRQTALLSHRTYTAERQALFDAILRLSFDLNRHAAPVPSQAWLARIMGMHKGDVCRAEKSLVGFGMFTVQVTGQGADKRRLYTPQPDASTWGGPGFHWRIADPQARALAILAECQLATCEGPEAPEQPKLALEFKPTITEEFNLEVDAAHRQAAVEAAGALPLILEHVIDSAEAPSPSSAPPVNPFRGMTDAVKARLGSKGYVGQPANEPPGEPSSALAAQPTHGESPLARQPTLPGPRWLPGQRSNPAPGGKTLAGQPTKGGIGAPPEPPGVAGVGQPANDPAPSPGETLAGQPTHEENSLAARPTNPAAHTERARERDIKHQTSNPSGKIYLTSDINGPDAASGAMGDVASVAGGMGDVSARAPDELLYRVFDVVRANNGALVNHWRKLLGPQPRHALALDLLGEIKIRRDERQHGRGKPIRNEGAWFVSEFYKRAGIPRQAKESTQPGNEAH